MEEFVTRIIAFPEQTTVDFITFLIIIIIKLYYRLAATHMRRQIWQLSKLQTLYKNTTLLTTDIVYSYTPWTSYFWGQGRSVKKYNCDVYMSKSRSGPNLNPLSSAITLQNIMGDAG